MEPPNSEGIKVLRASATIDPEREVKQVLINHNDPTLMHIDLNSCFATIEQQANPLWRGKPLVVAAYDSPGGCVLAPSIEAKKFGVKTGNTVRDAKQLCPEVIVRMPDPYKYHAVHVKLMNLFRNYTPEVTPKSVDEAVLDFRGTKALNRGLDTVATEIKQKIKKEVGEWLTVSVGISTNRFLAKFASSLHKPDGLDVVTHQNLEEVYKGRTLIDLPGINVRYEARLNVAGIFTPLDFLKAPRQLLEEVFHGIVGFYWYLRLRGYEIDEVIFPRRSFGQEYALGKKTNDPRELSKLLMKLCEKMGRRMRRSGFRAGGIYVACVYEDYTFAHKAELQRTLMYSTKSLFLAAMRVLNKLGYQKKVSQLSVSCYGLAKTTQEQLSLLTNVEKERKLTQALDRINDRYGDFVITPALMMGMDDLVLERVAFGGVRNLIEY